ncbi:uncharacterized protein LOC126376673 [Pectinophora gossypiella]|uniref:uncharacterized protein LOC126376673 n=1 Tax=Pectinophora gossypiella TaxID=13191 RepID=UPI00214F1AFD|nr:uncharacterized protein LOC126376673 [Pectinophora gossypiella]
MEWDEETTLKLINLYHIKELLWNPKHLDHKCRPKRFDALNEMANELNTNVTEIERKIKNLTSQYYRERKKTIESKKSGTSADFVHESKWFAFKSLNFLLNKNKPTGTIDTEITATDNNAQHADNDAQHGENDSPQTSNIIPQANKRYKPNPSNEMVSEALNLMRTVSQRTNQKIKDEDDLFGEYIATQLRKFDKTTKAIIKHRINNIFFETETGYRSDMFEASPRPSTSHSHPGYYTMDQCDVNSYYSSSNSAVTNPVSPPLGEPSTSSIEPSLRVSIQESGDIENILSSIESDK